ncbi:MAG: hypothetical protein JO091_02260 [Acidobacteriaceae bacterium]|nr:hypothetical protein [Acidobacteriaceae bacterium]
MLASILAVLASGAAAQNGQNSWRAVGTATETYITGGPWTLEQSGAGNGLKSSGYCDANGNQIGNPGTERMEPYYFPFIKGTGKHLQGYFDWRPKDTDEAVVAARSDDGGLNWQFQQEVLQLRTTCPNQVNPYPNGDPEPGPDPNNSDNGDDDGQGHQFVMTIAGHTYLYTLERANTHIDSDPLYIHEINPQPGLPLNGAPAANDGPTDENTSLPIPGLHTTGLLNPDGILGIVPGRTPTTIIYEQKILNGDQTTLPTCSANGWSAYYKNNPFGTKANDDVTYLRLAQTTDGINFTDLGILHGLNDPSTVSVNGTRWVATAGTILRYNGGKYGLFFSGGGCVDGDSDAFHYIGYAESKDLLNWTVINNINNPVLSTAPFTMTVDANGVPSSTGTSVTVPATPPIAGYNGFFSGRVYAPSGAIFDEHTLTIIFAGYHTPKPKNGLGDYRTIGHLSLHSEFSLLADDDDDWWWWGWDGDDDHR